MTVSAKDWAAYVKRLSEMDTKAGALVREWIERHGLGDRNAAIRYAYAVVQKYGEGAAALSAEMYDAITALEKRLYPPAEAAAPADYPEVAKTVNGILKHSQNPNSIANGVSGLVKRAGADTTLKNAVRDGAEFAWIPSGDTCPFCITLASNGWQRAGKKSLNGGHAEHIHANCDCTYAVRFGGRGGVRGYDPQTYFDMYNDADGIKSKDKINSMRRMQYAHNKEAINAQKREAYALRKEKEELSP